jgi:hypothetical protein
VVVLVAGVAAAALLIAGRWLSPAAATGLRRSALAAAALSLGLIAALAGPLAYSLDTVATSHTGALPTAGPALAAFGGPAGAARGGFGRGGFGGRGFGGGGGGGGGAGGGFGGGGGGGGAGGGFGGGGAGGGGGPGGGGFGRGGAVPPGAVGRPAGFRGGFPGGFRGRGGGGGGLGGSTEVSSALTALLRKGASHYRWAAATVSSDGAAPLQLASGDPIMAIGGFNGTDPAPTLAEFQRYVADHEIHYFVGDNPDSFGGGSGDAARITAWVTARFKAETVGGDTVYDLASPG